MMTFEVPEGPTLRINAPSVEAVLSMVEGRLQAGEGFTLATLNLDHLVKLRRSAAFRRAYGMTTYVTADGSPIVWLSRAAGRPVSLTPGSDLVGPLCALAARCSAPVALFGSSEAVLTCAADRLTMAHPGLAVALRVAPPYGFDPEGEAADTYARQIAESGARLCFLALGAPKQEIFAARAARIAPNCGFLSIGAGLDFVAGAQVRAPLWMRRLGFEWLWRLLSDPGRLAARYAACLAILPGLASDAVRLRVVHAEDVSVS